MQFHATQKIGQMVDDAVAAHGAGEEVLWESSIVPDPNGAPMLCFLFWMRGALLDTVMQGSFVVHDPLHATPESISATVSAFLMQMREARADSVATPATTPPPAPGQRPSGLLIP